MPCYVATTASGERFFVRAKPAERGADPEPIYEAVADHGATPSERPHTPAAAAAGAVRLRDGLAAVLSTLHGQSTTDDLQVNDRDMLS